MAINKKLIHFKKYSDFIGSAGINGTSQPIDGYYHNIPETSIVFIKDTKQIWTHGQLYSLTNKIVNHSDTTVTITPDEFHVWGSVDSLNISLQNVNDSFYHEYVIQFTSKDNTTLILPDTIIWENGIIPVIKPNTTYQISIVNNLAMFASFS